MSVQLLGKERYPNLNNLGKKKNNFFSRARDRLDHFLKHTFLNNRPTTYYYLIKPLYKLLLSINKEALNFKADIISWY